MTSLREPGERVRLAGRPTSLARTPQTVPTAASHQATRRSHGTGLGRDRHGVGPKTCSRGRQAATVHTPGRIETSPDRACPHGSPVSARNPTLGAFPVEIEQELRRDSINAPKKAIRGTSWHGPPVALSGGRGKAGPVLRPAPRASAAVLPADRPTQRRRPRVGGRQRRQ
jgi:hypothetical protein